LHHGGTLYIDEGRPLPGAIKETLRNVIEIAPTIYLNVPKGYESLIPHLRSSPEIRDKFFSRMRFIMYAAANMSLQVWNELKELAKEAGKEDLPILVALGSTETAPGAIMCTWNAGRPGIIGLPLPGVEAKLAPVGNKLELRLRGPNIMPGYYRDQEKTSAAFDEDGFYKLGDAVRLANPCDPSKGLEFDGRIAEDFKLSTGTWVNVGQLRMRVIQESGALVRDAVIAGHDRDYLSALIFPDIVSCKQCCQMIPPDVTPEEILLSPDVRRQFREILDKLASTSSASSSRIDRMLLMEEPPSIDANEITDKGSINQRAVLERRAALVEELYKDPPSRRVIVTTITKIS
jgi:feruloyl-CoA synthase